MYSESYFTSSVAHRHLEGRRLVYLILIAAFDIADRLLATMTKDEKIKSIVVFFYSVISPVVNRD
jgi:hypothetical protein